MYNFAQFVGNLYRDKWPSICEIIILLENKCVNPESVDINWTVRHGKSS